MQAMNKYKALCLLAVNDDYNLEVIGSTLNSSNTVSKYVPLVLMVMSNEKLCTFCDI